MNDAWDEFNANLNDANGPKALRDYAKAQKERADEMAKQIADIQRELNKAKVADLFESQGVARNAAKYYNGDADPEKVSAFVNDMRSAFGGAAPEPQAPASPALNSDDQEKLQRMMQAGSNGNPGGNADAALAALNAATSTADRVAAWNQFARGQ